MIAKLIQCLKLNIGLQLLNSLGVSLSWLTYEIAHEISAVFGGFGGFGGGSTPALLGGGTKAILLKFEERSKDRSRMSHVTWHT